jgi:tetratricopeptide (TPR) repeat protein
VPRARALLLQRALKYLDRLSSQAGDDPVLQREIAAAYVQLGTVQGSPTGASLGDLSAARQSYDKALSIARRLVAAHPGDSAARRVLARTHEKIGDAEAWTGDVHQGVEHARLALEHSRYLANAQPASATDQSSLATRHIKLGDLLGNPYFPNLADEAGALTHYRRALALLRGLHPDSAKQWAIRRRVGLVHERIGTMLRQDGRNDEALAELTQSLAIREVLARENSANVDALRDVAIAHQQLCGVQLARTNCH